MPVMLRTVPLLGNLAVNQSCLSIVLPSLRDFSVGYVC